MSLVAYLLGLGWELTQNLAYFYLFIFLQTGEGSPI